MGDKKRKKKPLDELTNLLKRVQADFENYKKRVEKEKQEFVKYASAEFAVKLLPVVDSFEHAMKNCSDSGIKMIYSQFLDVLSKQGLKRIDCVGRLFDPYLHEAMMQEVSDKEADTILEELQAGYMFNDAVIRHAKVKVAKNDKKENTIKGSA
jgi:molecular chaperone GrpE